MDLLPKLNNSTLGLGIGVVGAAIIAASYLLAAEPVDVPTNPEVPLPEDITMESAILPIPLDVPLDTTRVTLGRELFHDPQLSGDGTVSCASCHNLAQGGADGRVRAVGINGNEGAINAPSVFNAAFNFRQFWDGRSPSLEHQIDGPINNPVEMGASWEHILDYLNSSDEYERLFADAYDDGITVDNVRDALATFQRSLTTPNSRFDRFLRGEEDAITAEEREGYDLFQLYGCIACHQGVNVGGNIYQRFGIIANYFEDRGNITQADLGRYNVTGFEQDRHVFKVPTLRNVALTAPYFHDGSAETLEEAVYVMGVYQLGRVLSDEELDLIVQFLHTLTGEHPDLAHSTTSSTQSEGGS